DVLTYHNDPLLTGQNLGEEVLTPADVSANTFGKLATRPVDGYTYARPLYKAGLLIGGQPHDVAFVATEHDSVYAFAIVPSPTLGVVASPLWQTSFIDPAHGISTVPSGDTFSGDLVPEVGITGTPVIDGATNTLYVVAKTKEHRPDDTDHFVQKLYALRIDTG